MYLLAIALLFGPGMRLRIETMEFSEKLSSAIHANPDKPACEGGGQVYTKGEIAGMGDLILGMLTDAGIAQRASIGVIVRNRVIHGAAMLGLIGGGRWLTTIYAMQSAQAIAQEIRDTRFAAIIADRQDWSEDVVAAARETGTLGIVIDHGAAEPLSLHPELATTGAGPFRVVEGEPGLEVLSSGTTGKPKRVVFPARILDRMIDSVKAAYVSGSAEPCILTWPYGGIGGMCELIAATMMERYMVVLERFNVEEWVEAVERLKPRTVSGVPTVARMILDAKVPKERLASVQYFTGGSAPMTIELQDAFEEAYGIKVIWGYGATEFCGSVIMWTPALYDQYRRTKAGAMGKAMPGITLRTIDVETGAVLPAGQQGYLEALVPQISDDWIRTTDLVTIDEDDFVFHHGRGDGAIIRGGHKVIPEKVVDCLREHPAVLDAAVVGLPDERLGAVPMAVVELRAGAEADEAALKDHVRGKLTSPQVPAKIRIVPAIPRTTSLKADLTAVRRLLEAQEAAPEVAA